MLALARFGEELRAIRLELGLSLRQLAKRSGVSWGYVHDLESGRRGHRASDDVVERIAAALELTADVFQEYRQRRLVNEHADELDALYWRLYRGQT